MLVPATLSAICTCAPAPPPPIPRTATYRPVQLPKPAGRSTSAPDSPVPGTTARGPQPYLPAHSGCSGTQPAQQAPCTRRRPLMNVPCTSRMSTRAPRATPELPAPARQASSRTVTATSDRPRAYPPDMSRCQLDACQDAGRLDQGILCALPRGSGRVKGHHSRSGRARIAARGRAEAVPRRLPQRSPGTPDDRAVPSGIR